MKFDLLTRDWIPVVCNPVCPGEPGKFTYVSLQSALCDARRYRRLVGESPTMTAALHRMLLAVLHRVFGPSNLAEWEKLWNGDFDGAAVVDYARKIGRQRFDLFDIERPFLQTPELARLAPKNIAPLVPHRTTGNFGVFFDHTTTDLRPTLSPAEAARWLVTLQLFDAGGNKTPFSNQKSSERGYANNFGCALVEGKNLHETLLLNAVVYNPGKDKPSLTGTDDRPMWEGDPPSPEPDKRVPLGWTDLLTWPSRRVLLHTTDTADDALVNGVTVTPGTAMQRQGDYVHVEQCGAFIRQSRGLNEYKGIKLEKLRGVWRHARSLLLPDELHLRGQDPRHQRPRTMNNIRALTSRGLIKPNAVYTLRVFDQELDHKFKAKPVAWREESVAMPVALLRATDPHIGFAIGDAAVLADALGDALGALRLDFVAFFQGEDSENATRDYGAKEPQRVKELKFLLSPAEHRFWPRLGPPFDVLLRALGKAAEDNRIDADALLSWGNTATRIAKKSAGEWMNQIADHPRALKTAARAHQSFVWRCHDAHKAFAAKFGPSPSSEGEE